jgi:hypothetical protein
MLRHLFFLPTLFFLSCGYTEKEGTAAEMACECAQDKSVFGIANCFSEAVDAHGIDGQSLGYDRAIKEKCPDVYKRLMDFSKGKR